MRNCNATLRLALSLFSALVVGQVSYAVDGPDQAPQPTKAQAEQLIVDGDRLADQADYGGALERYTEAYHAVVSDIRGQRFSKRVLPNLLTRQELGQEMLQMIKAEYTPEEFALMDATFQVFGLVPPGIKSDEMLTRLLTEEVAGFYDPEKKRMVLIREDDTDKKPGFLERLFGGKTSFDKTEQKTTLAHEMTHALQDQLYDLLALQKRVEKDDDLTLAFASLVEGDATLVMFAEMDEGDDITKTDPELIRNTLSVMTWMLPIAGGPTLRKAPAIFRESLIFPYFQGMVFCVSITAKGGWPGLHAVYADPPASTEQILHPEKYTDSPRDEPQLVTIPELKSALSDGWEHIGGNCLGEFQTSILLKRLATGRRAAAGWDGDRYEVFRHSDGRLAVVYVSVWDSEKDAQQFAEAYTEYRQPPASTRKARPAATGEVDAESDSEKATDTKSANATAPAAARSIEQHGDRVWVIEGFSQAETDAIKGLLTECQFQPKRFPTE